MIDFKSLSTGHKVSLSVLTLAIISLAGYLIYGLVNPRQALIYQDQSLEQISKIAEQLEQKGIEYRLDESGTGVLVNENLASNAKVQLAGAQAGEVARAGFELFDNVDYSMTEHAQRITYQRALQGELERTLSAQNEIEQARVHIMIPQRKLFSVEQSKAKASVSLILVPGAEFLADKVIGVQALVASSVEGLAEQDVIVLNSDGIKISESGAEQNLPGKPQSKGQVALEQQLTQKALNLLSLYFSPDQVAVSVSAELDHVQTKQVKKELLGDSEERGFVTRRKESVSYRDAKDEEVKPAPNKQSEIEYNHGMNTEEKLAYAGALKKLSVAIAILADISEPQLDKIKALVIAGLGIDIVRGDQLSVESFKPLNTDSVVLNQPTTQMPYQEPKTTTNPTMTQGSLPQSEPSLLSGSLLLWLGALLLLMLFTLTLLSRRKPLSQAEKEQTLLEINQWLNDASQSKVGQNAK